MKKLLTLLVAVCISFSVQAQQNFMDKIRAVFPNAIIKELGKDYFYQQEYMVTIQQPLDHCDKKKGYFPQRFFLSHYNQEAPMLFVTEGYSAGPRHYELSDILKSNQVIIEYRFNGLSRPDTVDYKYLTNEQAMRDLHLINKKLKKLYHGPFISTGISKGGTTCLMYKATYPKDVEVAVPYVAPLPDAREDKRMDHLIQTVGPKSCRDKLERFQRTALTHRDSVIYWMREDAKKTKLTFNRIQGVEKAFEYTILEFTFSFWQMGHDCSEIPENPTAKETFNTLMDIVGTSFYSDAAVAYFEPAFYQFMTENGYYGFINEFIKDDLKEVKVYDNSIFGPRNVSLEFRPKYMNWIKKRLKKHIRKTIQIQGEYDPWAACGYIPADNVDALYMIDEKGSHKARIKDLSQEQQNEIYRTLARWLHIPIYPLGTKS